MSYLEYRLVVTTLRIINIGVISCSLGVRKEKYRCVLMMKVRTVSLVSLERVQEREIDKHGRGIIISHYLFIDQSLINHKETR